MAAELQLEGMQPEEVYANIVKQGVSKSDAAILVGDWLVAVHGGTKRVFNYSTAYPASEPDCVAHFARSFQHTDWVDGESVVQAGQTVGEDGFNLRLHQVEADLDALGDDVRHAFACLADSRAALAELLVELRTEINRINADIYDCCQAKSGTSPTPGGVIPGKFLGAQKFFDKNVLVYETTQGLMMLPGVTPLSGDLTAGPRIDRAVKLAKLLASEPEIGQAIAGGATKEQLIQRLGDKALPGDPPLSDLIDILPAGSTFASGDALSEAVTEREAAATRTGGLADAAIAQNFSVLGAAPTDVSTVSITDTVSIPEATRTGLAGAGIGTVGALAGATPADVQHQLDGQGVKVDLATAAGLVSRAKALTLLR